MLNGAAESVDCAEGQVYVATMWRVNEESSKSRSQRQGSRLKVLAFGR